MSNSNLLINEFNSSFLFGKFIDRFVVKSFNTTPYLQLLQKVFIDGNENQIITLHFGNTSYNYLYP